MIVDLTPSMTDVLSSIGNRSVTATEMRVSGSSMKRLWELGFLKMDYERDNYSPPFYSLSEKGWGAAAILTAELHFLEFEAPIARIKRIVAAHYRIPVEEMTSERRSRKVARPRQVAMYLTKKLTPKSLPEIGRHFGNRDHTTVIHAVRKVEQLMSEDHNVKDTVRTLFGALVSEKTQRVVDNPEFPAFVDSCEVA